MKNTIYLYGSVGYSWWGEDHFTAASVREQLAGMDGPLTVHINSGGGIATEGQAIYTMLVDYPDTVDVVIEGAAMSAASLIAMAGDTITMRLGSFMLIHDPASPWTEGRGTEEDHLRQARQLGVTSNGYAAIYAKRSGQTREAAREIMKAETLYDPESAMAAGFATATDDTAAATAAVFDYRMYANAPRAWREASEGLGIAPSKTAIMAMITGMPRQKQETTMSGNPADPAQGGGSAPVVAAAPVAAAPTVTAAVAQERQRGQRIRAAVMLAGLAPEVADELIDSDATLEAALDQVTAKWKEGGSVTKPAVAREPAKITMDARDKFKEGATKALVMKAGLDGGERNEFSGLTLRELAREVITASGERQTFGSAMDMIGHAFTMAGTHTTSDFAQILSNVQGKAALKGWEEAQETYPLFTRQGSLSDFKPTRRVDIGLMPALPRIAEGADYTYGTVGDRGEPIVLATYGSIIRISRQAVLNDDLSILGNVPRKMGRAARATVGNLVFAVLTGNPNLADGQPLFGAGRNNLATGAPSALQVTSLATAEAAMRTQRNEGQALNISPKYLLVPAALKLAANSIINSTVDPRDNRGHSANPVAGMAEIIADGRLDAASTTGWYLVADPQSFDTIEVAYLDGNAAPYLEEMTAWTSDGVEMKVRMDAGVAPLDFRTMYRSNGA